MDRLNVFKGGVIGLSFLLMGCTEKATVNEVCNSCQIDDAHEFQLSPLAVDGVLIFRMIPEFGTINLNIPPKRNGNKLFVLTDKNYLLKYSWKSKGVLSPSVVCRLPMNYERVSDYIVMNDSTIWFCSNEATYSITSLNTKTSNYKTIPTDTTMCHSMPFLGLSLQKVKDSYLFPMVRINDANDNGNFLSVYSKNGKYKYGLGNFSTLNDQHFAPYFDSPILSQIHNLGFDVATSSSNGSVECKIEVKSGKLNIVQMNKICWSRQLFNRLKGKLSSADLGDFSKMSKAYITDAYTMGLYHCGNKLIRISKNEQPLMNKITKTKNIILDAPWTMEVLDLTTQKGIIHLINAKKYQYTNAFVAENKFYVLSNQSNQNEIIYHVLH